MNRKLTKIARLFALLLLACLPGLSLSSVSLAQASTSTTQIDFPFVGDFLVPCANGGAGEIVGVNGTLHLVIHTTIDNTGGFRRVIRYNVPNLTGIGQITGDVYRVLGPGHITEITSAESSQSEFAGFCITNLIGPGPNNNLLTTIYIRLVINANGETTVDTNISTIECK